MSQRICNIHGKWNKTPEQQTCPKCKKKTHRYYDQHKRDKDAAKFYHSKPWKDARASVLARDKYLCQHCIKVDEATPAVMVDHIIEISDGGCKLCEENLESLCDKCHKKKTGKEKSRRRRGGRKSLQTESQNTEAPPRFLQKQFLGGTL